MQEYTINYEVAINNQIIQHSYTFLASSYEEALEQLKRKLTTDYLKLPNYTVL